MRMLLALVIVGISGLYAQSPHTWTQAATDGPNDYLYADSSFNQFVRDMYVGSDLDQDGLPEIILSDYKDGGRIHVFEVVGNDSIQEVWTFLGGTGNPTSQPARSVTVGDLDGDGKGEIIVAMTGNSGDTLIDHVGLWVFEWDGVTGSDNYGNNGQPSERYIDFLREPDGTLPDRVRSEDIAVGDFDGDGTQEVLWVNNASTVFDNAYIFSIIGDIGTGFTSVAVEKVFRRTDYGFGGSTNGAYGPMDLDGDGNPEGVIGVWNGGAFAIFEAEAPDSYALKYYVEGLDSSDLFPCNKISAIYDYDNDGKDEFFFSGEYPGSYSPYFASGVYIVNVNGSDIDSSTVEIDTLPIDNTQFGLDGLSVGDVDNDGKFEIYALFSINRSAISAEFQGGDVTNPDDYNVDFILPEIFAYAETTIVGTDTVLYFFEPSIVIKPGDDLDNDGNKEVVFEVYEGTNNYNYPYLPWAEGFLRIAEYTPTGVEEWVVLPPRGTKPEITRIAPDPVKDFANIEFSLPANSPVTVRVYDISGRVVTTLFSGNLAAGRHTLRWDARDRDGMPLSSGVYIIKLDSEAGSATRKVMVLK